MLDLDRHLEQIMPTALEGSVARTVGLAVSVADFPAPVGAVVEIERQSGPPLWAEVIGFRDDLTLVYPQADPAGVRRGNRVRLVRTTPWLRVGDELLGRVLDANGRCTDGKPHPLLVHKAPLFRKPPAPLDRPRIRAPLSTGIRAIDGLLTCGKGQRMGIFAGSGVGKSVTLGMMARYTSADVNVIALIGERGREVAGFLEDDLGPEGLARSVVVVSTSDEPAVVRARAAYAATAVAEFFRDQGRDVLLIMDSLTRFAQAQREIGLAAGEPPTTRGYPPSVFSQLPRLVERAGTDRQGSITALYSVLVEADDPNEPIADAVRGLLDGHTWLSRKLASRGHYPAIDVLESISRLMPDVADNDHRELAQTMRELLSIYRDHEDLISIGAYRRGANPLVDLSIDMQNDFNQFLRQRVQDSASVESAKQGLAQLVQACHQRRQSAAAKPGGGVMIGNTRS